MRIPRKDTQARGKAAEDLALSHLESKGLTLLDRNYRCRVGEIDLVMRDGNTLAFVEVRFRKNARFVTPQESVTPSKQRRILLAASHYLSGHLAEPCRFDVVAVTGEPPRIEWIPNAFQASA